MFDKITSFITEHKKAVIWTSAGLVALLILLKIRANSAAASSPQVVDAGGFGGITVGTPVGTGSTSFGSGGNGGIINSGHGTVSTTANQTAPTTTTGAGTATTTAPADTGAHAPAATQPVINPTGSILTSIVNKNNPIGPIKPIGGKGTQTF